MFVRFPCHNLDYDLHFPDKGIDHGVFMDNMPRMTRFTISFWMQTTEAQGTPFSYAMSDDNNNEVLVDFGNAGFSLAIFGLGK